MPPKKKGSSKKPPKVKSPILMDGLTKDEMTREQIVGYAARLQEELDWVREKKSFEQERDQYSKFLGISERELEEVEEDLKNEQTGKEEDKTRHQEEIQVIKQEMKFHLFQHQNTICELKSDAVVSTEAAQEEQHQLESELRENIKTIMQDMKKNLESHESHVKELELAHDKEMTEDRDRLEKQQQDENVRIKNKFEQPKQELERRRKKIIRDIEDQRDSHIVKLRGDVKEARKEISKLCEDLGVESFDSLEENKGLKHQIEVKKTDLSWLLPDNKHLIERLSEFSQDVAAVERHLKYKVKKNDAEMVRLKELSDLERKHEALEQIFRKLQFERDQLYKAVSLKTKEVQQKAGQRGEVLERKLSALTELWESTQTQLDVLSDSNMDQTALQGIMNQVEEKLDSGSNYIEDLKYIIAVITKHSEATQRALGVPVQDLHVQHDGSSSTGKNLEQEVGKKSMN